MFRGEKQQGFTLIELMVALAIAIIVIALSTPISSVFQRNRVVSIQHEFVTSLNLARSTAVSTATPVSICRADPNNANVCAAPAANGNRQWEHGWIVFTDLNSNGAIELGAGDAILQQRGPLTAGYTLRELQRDFINYDTAGLTRTSTGTWRLCDANQNAQFQRAINLSVSGRVGLLTPAQIQGVPCLAP